MTCTVVIHRHGLRRQPGSLIKPEIGSDLQAPSAGRQHRLGHCWSVFDAVCGHYSSETPPKQAMSADIMLGECIVSYHEYYCHIIQSFYSVRGELNVPVSPLCATCLHAVYTEVYTQCTRRCTRRLYAGGCRSSGIAYTYGWERAREPELQRPDRDETHGTYTIHASRDVVRAE